MTQLFEYSYLTGYHDSTDNAYVLSLNSDQQRQVDEALKLWEDVCNVDWARITDNPEIARLASTRYQNWSGSGWNVVLDVPWIRFAIGDLPGETNGRDHQTGDRSYYQEIYIDPATQRSNTFDYDSGSFYVALHESGHALGLNHVDSASSVQTIMNSSRKARDASTLHPGTPMLLDIDTVGR